MLLLLYITLAIVFGAGSLMALINIYDVYKKNKKGDK